MVVAEVFEGVSFIMESVTFVEFILEESIQTNQLALFMAIKQRKYSIARKALDLLENKLIPDLEDTANKAGWLAPYSVGAFKDFVRASKQSIAVYKEILKV